MCHHVIKIYVLAVKDSKENKKNVTTLVLCITKIDVVRGFF
jgi:hypothetical protein